MLNKAIIVIQHHRRAQHNNRNANRLLDMVFEAVVKTMDLSRQSFNICAYLQMHRPYCAKLLLQVGFYIVISTFH